VADLKIESDAVAAVGARLRSLAEGVETAGTLLEEALTTASTAISHPAMTRAIDSVGTLASQAHRRLSSGVGQLGEFANRSVTTIAETDESLAGALREAP